MDEHLGDGVYASHDGFGIVLAVNHHTNKVITLEEPTMRALVEFAIKHGMLRK